MRVVCLVHLQRAAFPRKIVTRRIKDENSHKRMKVLLFACVRNPYGS